MNVENAITESCDVFFYEISKQVGIDRISKVAKEFGLGQVYNIPLSNQKKELFLLKKWKKENLDESWYPGETLISAIGQGFVLTNPLQLANMTSIIASDGKVIAPKLINDGKIDNFKRLEKYKSAINIVKNLCLKL